MSSSWIWTVEINIISGINIHLATLKKQCFFSIPSFTIYVIFSKGEGNKFKGMTQSRDRERISGSYYKQEVKRGKSEDWGGVRERKKEWEGIQISQRDLSLPHKNKWHQSSCQSADVTQREAVRIHSSFFLTLNNVHYS